MDLFYPVPIVLSSSISRLTNWLDTTDFTPDPGRHLIDSCGLVQ